MKPITKSRPFKRMLKALAEERARELEAKGIPYTLDRLRIEVRREMVRKLREHISENNYITADIYQAHYKLSDINDCLYEMKYVKKLEDGKLSSIPVIADTHNIEPNVVEWLFKHRHILRKNATRAETNVLNMLKEIKRIPFTFQKIFFVNHNIYYADIFLHKYNTVIEVDGSSHDSPERQAKDALRTANLNSVGIKVVRISNRDALDNMKVAEMLYTIMQEHQKPPKRDREFYREHWVIRQYY